MASTQRRTRIPDRPQHSVSLWGLLKNCVGKELSKIPMPVDFSEPLSMLQRLAEDFEYSAILDEAAKVTETDEQAARVAAFTVSSYSTTSNRTAKPFNPLLGETYEFDRRNDMGWRLISEQVSHHPPIVAQHCEGKLWTFWQEFSMTAKFRGKYLQIIPLGISHLEFKNGSHYSWRKVNTTIHNIIVGKIWVDNSGDMTITNHTTGSKCHMTFIPYSYFSKEGQRRVKGYVEDNNQKVTWVINGTWDESINIAPVVRVEGTPSNPIHKTGPFKAVWKRTLPPSDSDKFYSFTVFACQLNEKENGVAPTDSRNRPDQRLMEEGKWEEANAVKLVLEEKQRQKKKGLESSTISYAQSGPVWFCKETDPSTGNFIHRYNGQYWTCKERQDWSRCPDIY